MHPGVQASVMWPGGHLSVCLSREVTAQPLWEHYVPGVPPPSPEQCGLVRTVLNWRLFFRYLYGLWKYELGLLSACNTLCWTPLITCSQLWNEAKNVSQGQGFC